MNVIDEMREKARDLQGVGEYWLAEHLEGWADRLAASGALVPVPWGDARPVGELHSRQKFTCDHPGVWMIFGCSKWNFDIRNISTYAEAAVTENAIVQPLNLVPIAEASI